MAPEPLVRFFQSTGLIPPHKAVEIAGHFGPRSLEKGELFLKAGRTSSEYLFLTEGFMRAYAIDTEGNEVTTAFYYDNQVVFEVSSFFNRTPSQENIQALTRCEGWCISYDRLNALVQTLPEFREFGRYILLRGCAGLKDRMLSMITETADQRYERLLKTAPKILQQAPLKYIASYLGITSTSLSRIRKELSQKASHS
jgi:CRP-like cAMP-binding protein